MDRAVGFYQAMGLQFARHAHGTGPEHYSAESHGFIFEIYPQTHMNQPITGVRLGFLVEDVESILDGLVRAGGTIVSKPADSQWGRRAVVRDVDGNTIEITASPRT